MRVKSLLCVFIIDKDTSLTGAPRTVLNLLSGLHERGFQPVLVTQQESPLTRRLRDRGVEVEILPLPSILDVFDEGVLDYSWAQKAKALGAVLTYNWRIMQLADKHKANCIWARQIKGILLAGFAARWSRRSLIWDIGVEKESKGLIYHLHTLGLLFASKVVTQARIQPRVIFGEVREQWFESKFEAINPGIDDERRHKIEEARKERQSSGTVEVITVGSVHPRKNQRMLLEGLPKIIEENNQVRVRIVGPFRDENYASELQKFVDKKNLYEHVDFLGWRTDVPSLLGDSDIFVLCSQAEGVPQVIREAMYARLPVVATAVGGVPEAIRHGKTGFLVQPENRQQMKKYLLNLVSSPEKRRHMGERALRFAEKRFSKESWISSYAEMLRNLS
jgi:glycosyltransferase involved in cell wall biosynthesis